jgi:tetratricopeptide (TPR) repeat protein
MPSVPVAAPSGPETPEARGDRLAAAGDLPGAIVAYREALAADPLNDGVLGKIAALRRPSRDVTPAAATPVSPAPVPPAPVPARGQEPGYGGFALDSLDTSTFAEIDPVALDEAGAVGSFDPDEIRALVAVGMHADALALLEGADGLEATVLRALAYKGLGDASTALNLLRDARDEGDDSDPVYAEVMFELAALIAATGKHRSAMLLLEELRGLFPDFRSTEVDARIRGLARLVK